MLLCYCFACFFLFCLLLSFFLFITVILKSINFNIISDFQLQWFHFTSQFQANLLTNLFNWSKFPDFIFYGFCFHKMQPPVFYHIWKLQSWLVFVRFTNETLILCTNVDELVENHLYLTILLHVNCALEQPCSKYDHIPSHYSATESRLYEIARMLEKFILHATWMKAERKSNRRKQ